MDHNEALKLAFFLGFKVSGEGWNGEYGAIPRRELEVSDKDHMERHKTYAKALDAALRLINNES